MDPGQIGISAPGLTSDKMPPIVSSLTPVTRTWGAVCGNNIKRLRAGARGTVMISDDDEVYTMSGDVGVDVILAPVTDQSYLNSIRVLMRGW